MMERQVQDRIKEIVRLVKMIPELEEDIKTLQNKINKVKECLSKSPVEINVEYFDEMLNDLYNIEDDLKHISLF